MSDDGLFPHDREPPPPRVVEASTSCIQCGYDLVTQNAAGACPECGTPVEWSLHGDTLNVADPAWVSRLNMGVTLMLVYFLVAFLTGMFSGALRSQLAIVVVFLSLLGQVMSLAAMWLITEPEPRAWRAEENVTLRKALRVLAVVGAAGALLTIAAEFTGQSLLGMVAGVLSLISVPGFWLYYLHLSRLSLRVPDQTMARQMKTVMWGYTISMGAILLGAMLAMAIGMVAAVMMCPAAVAVLVFTIWSIVLHVRLRKVLARCEENARAFRARRMPAP